MRTRAPQKLSASPGGKSLTARVLPGPSRNNVTAAGARTTTTTTCRRGGLTQGQLEQQLTVHKAIGIQRAGADRENDTTLPHPGLVMAGPPQGARPRPFKHPLQTKGAGPTTWGRTGPRGTSAGARAGGAGLRVQVPVPDFPRAP
jgi:hypothetical protein